VILYFLKEVKTGELIDYSMKTDFRYMINHGWKNFGLCLIGLKQIISQIIPVFFGKLKIKDRHRVIESVKNITGEIIIYNLLFLFKDEIKDENLDMNFNGLFFNSESVGYNCFKSYYIGEMVAKKIVLIILLIIFGILKQKGDKSVVSVKINFLSDGDRSIFNGVNGFCLNNLNNYSEIGNRDVLRNLIGRMF